jgi:hypothetical protein
VLADRVAERPRQRPRAFAEGALSRHDQPIRRPHAPGIARHLDVDAPASRRRVQRALDASQIAEADVAHRDAHADALPRGGLVRARGAIADDWSLASRVEDVVIRRATERGARA